MLMARADGADLLLSLLNPRAYPIRAETQYVSVPITLDLIVVELLGAAAAVASMMMVRRCPKVRVRVPLRTPMM